MKEMVNVHAAKTNFSKLLARVASGEEIIIARGGVPVAKLVPYASESQQRPLGMFAGQMWMSEDALETPAWLLDAFEGSGGGLPPSPAAAALPVPPRARVAEPTVPRKPRKK